MSLLTCYLVILVILLFSPLWSDKIFDWIEEDDVNLFILMFSSLSWPALLILSPLFILVSIPIICYEYKRSKKMSEWINRAKKTKSEVVE